VMGVNDVGSSEPRGQARRQRVNGVSPEPDARVHHTYPQTFALDDDSWPASKGNELAIDLGGKGPGKLERIALPSTQDPLPFEGALSKEGRRSHLNQPQCSTSP
jgi:hypothetical protein